MTGIWCATAWLPEGPVDGVRLTLAGDRIADVSREPRRPGDLHLTGFTLPGLADAHSHAFHRALRGAGAAGTFWSWRDAMYAVADRLDPDTLRRLATAVFAEMALAGVTVVGEFHYLHHPPGGGRYADPLAMGRALAEAAAAAGIRMTLLDTCYLRGGPGRELAGAQLRFGDGSVEAWAQRTAGWDRGPLLRAGAAVHSVRAVAPEALGPLAQAARELGRPLHVHVSEQPAENEACRAETGRSPSELLDDTGVLGPDTTAVHATVLEAGDLARLAAGSVCLCPSTEADLGDGGGRGVGPAHALAAAGARLCLGGDSHAVSDPLLEVRGLEHGARLAAGRRGIFTPEQLLDAASAAGYAALGWDGGRLVPGALADLTVLDRSSPRLVGCPVPGVLLAGCGADVTDVIVGGEVVVREGHHVTAGSPAQVGEALARAIAAVGPR